MRRLQGPAYGGQLIQQGFVQLEVVQGGPGGLGVLAAQRERVQVVHEAYAAREGGHRSRHAGDGRQRGTLLDGLISHGWGTPGTHCVARLILNFI